MEHCTICLAPLAPNQVLYTPAAKVICASCNSKIDLVDTDKRAANNIVRNGTAALTAGLASVPVLLFVSMIAGSLPAFGAIAVSIVMGILAIRALQPGNERFTKHLSDGKTTYVWIATIVGWSFCLFTVGLMFLAPAIIASSSKP
jgi:hypothetical protein